MATEDTFADLIQRAANGDELAAENLWELYLPQIRRYIRMRLTDRGLRRQMDSLDVCQSIFGTFFVRLALGLVKVESPEQMLKLLATMARNRLINHNEKQRAGRRDVRRLHHEPVDELPVPGREATASQIVAARETLQEIHQRLTADERRICDRRSEGASWEEIAQVEGRSAEAIRKQYSRAMERLIEEFGDKLERET